MAYSINRRPLLAGDSDSEFEEDVETEIDDGSVLVPDQKPFLKAREIHDKYHLVHIIIYILGINTLIPWCFFITADDYWMYKFRDVHPNNTGHENYTHFENLQKRTPLQASFTSYLSVSSAIPNTIFLLINTFITKHVSVRTRMVGSQIIVLALFIMTTSLVKVNTDGWQNQLLFVTLATMAVLNAASAIFGGSLMGIVGRLSPKYITAMSAGQALAGIFTALTEIGSLWIGASPVLSGLVYFIIGDIVLLISLVAYIALERTAYFKYHMIEKLPEALEGRCPVNDDVTFSREYELSYKRVLKRTWQYGASVFLVFFITISVYPAVTVLIESEHKGNGQAWNDVYFVPSVTYLIFSSSDYIGRLLAGIFQWPKGKPYLLIFFCLVRAFFIPALMLCNAQPREHLPVYINNDLYYILITVIFAMTNGYFCNLVFILAPTVVDSHEKELASTMLGGFLGIGLSLGSATSLLLVKWL